MSKLTEIAERIDETLREWDFSWNRTTGGVLDRRLRIERHTMGGLVLPTALVFILWCGPVAGGGPRFWLALLGSLIGVVVMVALMRETQKPQMPLAWDLVVQLALFALTIAAVARFGSERPGPEGQIYPHIIMLGAVAFGFCAIVAVVLARWAFQRREAFDTFAPILRRCELFVAPRNQVTITWALACQAAAVAPFRNPEHLLFLPALAALLAPGTIWFGFRACAVVGLGAFVVNSGLVVLGQLDRRLGSMIALSQALLFRGTSLVVSGLIVALAMARLANIDYVSTLLDSVQTNDIVVSFAWAAYIVAGGTTTGSAD